MVRNALAGYSGVVLGVYIQGVAQATGQEYAYDRAEAGTDLRRFITRQDFLVSHSLESV